MEAAQLSTLGAKTQLSIKAVDVAKKEASPLGALRHLAQVAALEKTLEQYKAALRPNHPTVIECMKAIAGACERSTVLTGSPTRDGVLPLCIAHSKQSRVQASSSWAASPRRRG
eukprot:SAG22_NODE_213_length_15041_cov_3.683732_10_plen_114_part_00